MCKNPAGMGANQRGIIGGMTDDPLAALGEQYKRAKKRHDAAKRAAKRADEKRVTEAAALDAVRESLRAAIVDAGHARRRPIEISRLTGYGPEMVRQILRAAGVEPFDPKPSN